ncbi:MAG: hypothetical protein HS116_25370 [Planctomycetes bacterium]|nr:hypothetical protein [Planctomycetota bacterium]MBE7466815.1 hypothetical protein [Planctomycetota bacterium]
MSIRIGMEAKLYFKVGGLGAGAWVELPNVRDVTLNLETGEADVTTRGNAGWKASIATLKDASLEMEMIWDTADAGFTAIKNAYFNNEKIGFAVMDGDIAQAGSQGLQADFSILSFSRKEALEEAITVSVTAKPTYSATAPQWVTV